MRVWLCLWLLAAAGCQTAKPRPVPKGPDEGAALRARVDALAAQLANPGTREKASAELLGLGPPAATALLTHAANADPTVRHEVVGLLGSLGDPAVVPTLIEGVLRERVPYVRWQWLRALHRFPATPAVFDGLRAGLLSESDETRWSAAFSLSTFDRADGLSILHTGVADARPERRLEALDALGRVHDEYSLQVLENVLSWGNVRERGVVVLTLGQIGGEGGSELLIRALADPEPAVRWRACLALELTRDRRAVQALEDLKARESDDRVRRFAERALDRIQTAP